ncbi:MAG: flagellar hook-basal body complex protein [Pirellulales bacterium]
MGLASALSTALTGLSAAETTIDVVGNNVANAGTVGFKESEAVFATQFLQTQSLGSAPTASNGGINPRQIGLGVITAAITPNFTQGTIQVSSSSSDLAIQGDGFFIVQGAQNETLYTRDGQFTTNAENQLVTINGDRVLGQGVDANFQLASTTLTPLTIPLGATAVAQATTTVDFQGTLTASGTVATTGQIVQTASLGDASVPAPTTGGAAPEAVGPPATAASGVVSATPGGIPIANNYRYFAVFIDADGNESAPSPISAAVNVTAANSTIDVTIPTAPAGPPGNWVGRRIYRTDGSASTTAYRVTQINDIATTNTFADGTSNATLTTQPQLVTTVPGTGLYQYLVTFAHDLGSTSPSRPAPSSGTIQLTGNRVILNNLPNAASLPPQYNRVNIYRNTADDPNTYYLVGQLDPTVQTSFMDTVPDAVARTQPVIDLDGPKIQQSTTNVVDILRREGTTYTQVFQAGTLTFTPQKGGQTLAPRSFTITNTTKVSELLSFMQQVAGIQTDTDPINPIPNSLTPTGTAAPGISVTADGRIQIVSNNGTASAIDITLAGLKQQVGANQNNVSLSFGKTQDAVGTSVSTDLIVYDSLGSPLNLRITAVLESRDSSNTTYRWYADSTNNDPSTGNRINVGTGLIRFDGTGGVLQVTNAKVSIDRASSPSISPLEFNLDFSQVSGLAANSATLTATRQDGSSTGTLASYLIGGDGRIRGVFTNGVTRDLGQVRLARFANPGGLDQRGQNNYAVGINSGLPIVGNPGEQGIGKVVPGAKELSNTDIGKSLIDLITASTQYRGNARVITTAEQLLDELLNLRR